MPDFLIEPPLDAHAKIGAIYQYWQKAAPGPGLLPGRQHIDPAHFPKLLENVWMVDVGKEPMQFRFRLVGGLFHRVGSPVKRGDLIEPYLGDDGRELVMGHLRVCATSGKPLWFRGQAFLPHARVASELERIFLPLAQDGKTVDILLCLTIYYTSTGESH
jgi:hypothetical protein